MSSLMALGTVAIVILFWIFRTRAARQRWVDRLDLIGQWDLEGQNEDKIRIEFIGVRGDRGNYMASTEDTLESGSWHLTSYSLVLEAEGEEAKRFDLRLFEKGRIGVHGEGRERQIYRKRRTANIIKLPQHQKKNPT